ncbi:hypothetical protein B0A48_04990 [Cryoendolithus antarcticus]|uniref:Uncharacterized protein n=1 Tax=Cryoendolithus antarcticus TaxID=1507870 RepID=A0A1V8TEC1_9PEZI|nr:hypothetical protein B0A48_04990 [Cryoendolithus antarcticus]
MATILARPATLPGRSTPPPGHLSLNTSQRGTPAAIPNKHIPHCSPGPRPASRLISSPTSPPSATPGAETTSLLYPPTGYKKASVSDVPVYALSGAQLAQAFDHLASQPLPSAKHVFPWLHGLHADNQLQLAFFIARKKSLRRTPRGLRGITIVKAGGDLTHSKLKGAIAPEEILQGPSTLRDRTEESFLECDPREGFSVRNFQIQACKMATVSDIVVYGDAGTPAGEVERLAGKISKAQRAWQRRLEGPNNTERPYNTFVVTDPYSYLETDHADLIALDSEGCMTSKVMDFFHWERLEMCAMSAPAEIASNVWLGPTPDPSIAGHEVLRKDNVPSFDIMIEASDIAQIPDSRTYDVLEDLLEGRTQIEMADGAVPQLEFPGSGAIMPPTWSQNEVDGLVEACSWIYRQANGVVDDRKRRDSKMSLGAEVDSDGDSAMHLDDSSETEGRKILIHCTDGYTESSLLALAYFMYAECLPVHDAWLKLHMEKKRNFFAYSSDVALLKAIQPRLLQASPKHTGKITQLCPPAPGWLERMDGSLPSRIMPYMYLGNLGHANNPGLLKELGIGQVLSVGEPLSWEENATGEWLPEKMLFVDKVQDNGVDPLWSEFSRCLDFIEKGRRNGTATLVHCRVGVSRSATICIAEVMNELGLSFPRAYCFVRARRLNVIIQPHLRFTYELLKWEELQCEKRGKPMKRELEWATIAREIAAMNKPYSRQG